MNRADRWRTDHPTEGVVAAATTRERARDRFAWPVAASIIVGLSLALWWGIAALGSVILG